MASHKKGPVGPSSQAWAIPNKDHRTDFRDLLLWMVDQGNNAWDKDTQTQSPTLYAEVNKYFNAEWRRLDAKELELGFTEGEFPSTQGGTRVPCVVLKPPKPSVLPVLAPQFVFARDQVDMYPALRLHVAVFFEDDEDRSDVHVLGYRFEPPEGPGMHDYAHFQYINGLGWGRGDKFAHHLLYGYPLDVPAWPLWVDGPASMLAAVYVGLYGVKNLPADHTARKVLDDFVSSRLIVSPKSVRYKFNGCPELSSDHVHTWEQQAQYIQHRVKKLYRGRNVTLELIEEKPKGGRQYEMFWADDLPKRPGP